MDYNQTPEGDRNMETMGNLRRTRYCGEVRLADAGQEMVVAGSVAKCRDKGGIIFVDLRDTSGILQLVLTTAPTGPCSKRPAA